VRLADLVAAAEGVRIRTAGPDRDPDLVAVVHDTRDVVDGALFCCVRGTHVDGHDLAPAAVASGAAALLVDHALPLDVPQLVVEDVRAALGPLADAFWDHPSRHLDVLGVTGTSGKTTVTHLLATVLSAAGRPCAVIGTLSGARTTPEAPELQALLADRHRRGDAAVALEVSSHGLDQGRVGATRFAAAMFTNLSQDHLDYHGSMEAYFRAKARLFTSEYTSEAVVCVDEPWGVRLADEIAAERGVAVHRYSLADATRVRLTPRGATFRWRGEDVTLALAGRFNVRNAVGAATVAAVVGLAPADIARGLSQAAPVPGRFEAVDGGQPFTVLVDYAHKPDALEQALGAARELVVGSGRLTIVFGCGGDRDRAKRPVMGEVAARLADRTIVTSDNPRSEDPQVIIDEILAGVPAGAAVEVVPDRRAAMLRAVSAAHPGDVVVVAGKGHETTQMVAGQSIPFDDRVVAREALARTAVVGAVPGARRPSKGP
jgi:UDP-N-acetylmuramoyl-L-alanyl-D-glutamate--2,6-diaminopimelate ligase